MRPAPLLVVVGVLIALAGLVFMLQGMGMVGPSSSFMYSNPAWIYQGLVAAVVGLLIVVGGIVLGRRRSSVGPAA